MTWKVLIAHAENEDDFAEKLAEVIRSAGYEVAHRGTVMVGESVTEEASKILMSGGPIVLCGTVKALGTSWAHRVINSARHYNGVRIFGVQMERDAYVQQLSLDGAVAPYWQDPTKAGRDLIASLEKYYPLNSRSEDVQWSQNAERRYRELALASCDIIDLANLPENDRHVATRQLELRRLYVPLRVFVEVASGTEISEAKLLAIEERRSAAWRALPASLRTRLRHLEDEGKRVPIGHRLAKCRQLVVLGDPGARKTTLIRWIATAYLLHLKQDPDWKALPDVATLPDEDWVPIVVRCRDLDQTSLGGTLDDFLRSTLRRAETLQAEAEQLQNILRENLRTGKALLLIDGLDEISDPSLRARFCQQLEQIRVAFPAAPIIVTSRIVGYREMGYRIGRGFEHLTVADLSMEDKDDFAQRWCAITERPERCDAATTELIHDIHSTDRIERLTDNPMLLTTMALVKRKVGRLPSRRADLYWDALEVLLNWRREVDEPIDHREAVPQLEYVAYAMCDRGVQQLREDEIIALLESLREEYPQIYTVRQHTAAEFLHLLERRTGILVQAGHVRHSGRPMAMFEFRHLTFQEYLASLALVDGRFPNRDRTRTLSEHIAPLAGQTSVGDDPRYLEKEVAVTENWHEPLRLCVASCNDDDVDSVLSAILHTLRTEDGQLTARPRAVLAALCLADEPNVSQEIAETVLREFVRQVGPNDGAGQNRTSVDAATIELAISRWSEGLRLLLLERFRSGDGATRGSFGGLFSLAAATSVLHTEIPLTEWLPDQTNRLASMDEEALTATALTVMEFAFSQKISVLPGLVEGFVSALSLSAPTAHAAAWALRWLTSNQGWQPTRAELDLILSIANDQASEPSLVRLLIVILGLARYMQAVDLLIHKLDDGNSKVRAAAVTSLGQIEDLRAVDSLVFRADDDDETVRKEVSKALGQIGDLRAIEPLIARLSDENSSVREASAIALGKIGDVRAIDPLILKLDEETLAMRRAAAAALARIGDARAIGALLVRLDDENPEVRQIAANGLAQTRDPLALDPLVARLNDNDRGVRDAITHAFDRLATSRFIEGDVSGAGDVWDVLISRTVTGKPNNEFMNNRAYCHMLLGQYQEAAAQFALMDFSPRNPSWPIWQHNNAVLSFLRGDEANGRRQLEESLEWIVQAGKGYDPQAFCMLLLQGATRVTSHQDLPVDAAVFLNLFAMGNRTVGELTAELSKRYPGEYRNWMAQVLPPQDAEHEE